MRAATMAALCGLVAAATPASADSERVGSVFRGNTGTAQGIIVQENSPFDLRRRTDPTIVEIIKLRRGKLRRSLSEFSASAAATLARSVYDQVLDTGSTDLSVVRRKPSRIAVERGEQSRLLVGKRNPALFTRRFRSRDLRLGLAIGLSLAQVELRRREELALLAAQQEQDRSVRRFENPRTISSEQFGAARSDPAVVADIQRALQSLGYNAGLAGRGLSTQTVGAIMAYQMDNQLLVNGVPSAALLDHMQAQDG